MSARPSAQQILVRVSPEEKRAIEAHARAQHLSVSRYLALCGAAPPEALLKALPTARRTEAQALVPACERLAYELTLIERRLLGLAETARAWRPHEDEPADAQLAACITSVEAALASARAELSPVLRAAQRALSRVARAAAEPVTIMRPGG